MSPRLTARIRVDLLIPSQRAASLVDSAGFMDLPTGANVSSGANLRGSGSQAAKLLGMLRPSGGRIEVDQPGPDEVAQAALHGVHAFLGAGLEHISKLPRLSFLDQVLHGKRVEQDLEGG